MTVDATQTDAASWTTLAEQQVEDTIRRVSVFAKVSVQLQALKLQFGALGIGAQIVEHTLGSGKEDNEDREDPLSSLGRSLDQYL